MTLKEFMATIGHSSPVAALRYQHFTAASGQAIARYLDDVIARAEASSKATTVRLHP